MARHGHTGLIFPQRHAFVFSSAFHAPFSLWQLLSTLAFCHTWLQFATLSYTCSILSFLLLFLSSYLLCGLQNWFLDMTLFMMTIIKHTGICHTWLQFATHSYTCSLLSFLLLFLSSYLLCRLQNWFVDMTLFIIMILLTPHGHTGLHLPTKSTELVHRHDPFHYGNY